MKHTNDSSNSRAERHYGSEANKAEWQRIRAARRQGNVPDSQRVARFGGDSATTAVGEAVLTYGKAKPNEWDFDASLAKGNRAPISKVERQDKRESGRHILAWTPKVEFCYPAARNPSGIVAVSQGSRVAKRFRVDSVDRVTGEDTSMLVTLVTNEIHMLCYGQHFVFSKTNRSNATFRDSRTASLDNSKGKSFPLSFAKSELIRMLGVTEGMAKYAELVALPPKNPVAPKSVEAQMPSNSVAGPQGGTGIKRIFDEQGIRVA